MTESICQKKSTRFVFSRQHPDLYELYQKHISLFWTVNEIDIANDVTDWNTKLNDDERFFIKNILAFFAFSDGIVMENLMENFCSEVQLTEAKHFYAIQNLMESIHSETYELMLRTFCDGEDEINKYINALDDFEALRRKAEWIFKYMNGDENEFAVRLLAFACVEGIMFSGSFCSIFWLKQKGVMPGLTFSNELISRDEALHTQFACLLYGKLDNPLSEETVHSIIDDAVNVECDFLCESLPCDLIGMNRDTLRQYIHFVGDHLIGQLNHSKLPKKYEKMYNVENPYPWMDLISMQGKTNFFEKRVSEYSRTLQTTTSVFETVDEF